MSSIKDFTTLTLPGSMPNQTLPAYMDPVASFSQPNVSSMLDWGKAPAPIKSWSDGYGMSGQGGFSGAGMAAPPSAWDNFLSGMLGKTNDKNIKTDGWGGLALGAAQGIGNAFMGMQQYGLAKDSLENSKQQFAKNYEAQKTTTNAALEDRQRARVASNAGAYLSPSDYMNKNGVK